jgi:hypothetical protein
MTRTLTRLPAPKLRTSSGTGMPVAVLPPSSIRPRNLTRGLCAAGRPNAPRHAGTRTQSLSGLRCAGCTVFNAVNCRLNSRLFPTTDESLVVAR